MNTAYCNDCREFVTHCMGCCSECNGTNIIAVEDIIDAAEHRMGRRGEDV